MTAPSLTAHPSPDHLRLAMEAGHMGIWELSPADGQCRWSRNTPAIVGWPRDQLPTDAQDLLNRLHPDDRAQVRRNLFRLLRGDEDLTCTELRIVLPDESVRWFEVRGHLVEDTEGNPLAAGTFHDISARKEGEQGRQISEERLRLALFASGVGTWELDLESGISHCSAETMEIMGICNEPRSGPWEEFLPDHREDRRAMKARIEEAFREDIGYSMQYRVELPGGELRWIQAKGQVLPATATRPRRLVGTVMDISEARRSRNELETQARLFSRQARILEQTQRVAKVGGFEWDGRTGTGYWTDEMYRLRGVDPDTFDPSRDDFWIGFGARERVAIRQALSWTGGNAEPEALLLPMEQQPEGNPRWVNMVIQSLGEHDDGDGETDEQRSASYHGAITDVTERDGEVELLKRVAHLVSTETGTAFLQAVTRDLAEVFEADEAFVARTLAGSEGPGIRLRTLTRWTRSGRHDPVEYPVEGTPCGAVVRGEVLLMASGARERYPDGVVVADRPADAYAGAPLVDSRGEVMGLIGILSATPVEIPEFASSMLRIFAARTSAELERMETAEALAQKELELNQSQKMESIGKLAGGIAHDFNNILTVINGSAELALADLNDPEGIRQSLADIHRSGRRAADLTRHLLAFARKQVLTPSVVDPGEVLEGARVLLDRLLGDTVNVSTRFNHGDTRIQVDPTQLERVLMNLALNARDAMPDGGSLTFETSVVELRTEARAHEHIQPPGHYLRITVTDTGVGIPAEIQSRIFEPFFSTKPVGTGTGLGLSSVYGIVRQSGGFVSVTSVPGEGSSFRIDLPCSDRGKPIERTQARAKHGWAVLLIEEDEEDGRRTKGFLEEHGLHVIPARGVLEARRILDHPGLAIRLVVTDRLAEGQIHLGLRDPGSPPVLLLADPGTADPASGVGHLPPHRFDILYRPFPPEQLASRVFHMAEARMAGNR
ncbi:MAG: PAS domain S-box protein [Gemmatimonadales bacterium]|nr:MAG: PAS domain S-box protein [Gemmatimonadales bacterium]